LGKCREAKVGFHRNASRDDMMAFGTSSCALKENLHLVHVAEFRVSVSEVPDLSFRFAGKTVVSLAQVTLPVLPFRVDNAEDREQEDADLAAQIDSMSGRVLGRVCRSICPTKC